MRDRKCQSLTNYDWLDFIAKTLTRDQCKTGS